jgi:ribonucleoside-diphosphate reductase alpha chain
MPVAVDPKLEILKARYMHEGETDAEYVWSRVANAWSNDEDEERDFFYMMAEGRALPNTPAIANAGRSAGHQMGSACFVLPIHDSVDSIMSTMHDAALVQKSGGGTGFDFSELRAAGSPVSTTGRKAPGPVNFLQMYSSTAHYIDQGGMRDQANMGILRVDHPDVMQFIHCKQSSDQAITNFNISVAATDDFMRDATDPYKRELHGLRAPVIWDAIVENAWGNGDPGLWFVDTTNRLRLHPELYAATNPCGEVPLLPYEACVLGSVTLAAHLRITGSKQYHGDDFPRSDQIYMYGVDWQSLGDTVRTLTRMLDNVVDLQDYPLPIIRDTHHRYRKIGVGVMGFADMLVMMGVRYGSPASIDLAEEIMAYVQQVTYMTSEDLATEKGMYPGYYEHSPRLQLPKRRNLCCQVIAPTGSISRLAGCSFGIEPNFAGEYDSFVVGQVFHEVHPLKDHAAFVTTYDVTPEEHVRVAAAFQRYVDQGVSKTVNLPNSATRQDVADVYRLAWELGMKGITCFRDDSKETQVIKRADACVDGKCSL